MRATQLAFFKARELRPDLLHLPILETSASLQPLHKDYLTDLWGGRGMQQGLRHLPAERVSWTTRSRLFLSPWPDGPPHCPRPLPPWGKDWALLTSEPAPTLLRPRSIVADGLPVYSTFTYRPENMLWKVPVPASRADACVKMAQALPPHLQPLWHDLEGYP